jgi:hypothetical protein
MVFLSNVYTVASAKKGISIFMKREKKGSGFLPMAQKNGTYEDFMPHK